MIITTIALRLSDGKQAAGTDGGDEFAIILIDADSDITQAIRKRIEISIREECNLGVSVGYAQFSDGLSSDGFLTEADNRLYEAKAKKKEEK